MKQRIKKKKRTELVIKKQQQIIEELQNKIKYDDYLKIENKKLIDWVQKILKEFGTQEVRERSIHIPIMRNNGSLYDNTGNIMSTTEEIIIPEIRIRKISWR